MKATEAKLSEFLKKFPQFIIPIYHLQLVCRVALATCHASAPHGEPKVSCTGTQERHLNQKYLVED